MNLPNSITMSRIVMIPLLLWILSPHFPWRGDHGEQEILASVLFVLASITDGLDGYLARKRSQITTMGMLLDPLADKIMVTGALIALVAYNPDVVKVWIAVVIIGREFLISGLRSIASSEGFTIQASDLGKLKTVIRSSPWSPRSWRITGSSGSSAMLVIPVSWIAIAAIYFTVVVSIISAIDYFVGFWKQIDHASKDRRKSFVLTRRKSESAPQRSLTAGRKKAPERRGFLCLLSGRLNQRRNRLLEPNTVLAILAACGCGLAPRLAGLHMRPARQPMHKVIRRPGTGKLHLALAHHRAGGGELVLVALHILAVDQMSDIQHHLAALGQPAAYFFVQRHKQPVHLEAHCPGPRLALALPRSVLAQVGEILAAHAFGRLAFARSPAAAVVHEDLQVHLGLAAQLVDVRQKLALVGPDGLAQALVVVENRPKAERQHRGMLEAVRDHPGMIHAGFLI